MDPLSIAFYAAICATLSVVAPNLGSMPIRLGVGAVVGIAGAILLPLIRSGMGY